MKVGFWLFSLSYSSRTPSSASLFSALCGSCFTQFPLSLDQPPEVNFCASITKNWTHQANTRLVSEFLTHNQAHIGSNIASSSNTSNNCVFHSLRNQRNFSPLSILPASRYVYSISVDYSSAQLPSTYMLNAPEPSIQAINTNECQVSFFGSPN